MKNDHQLIREFQAGDRKAFDQLVRRHLASVRNFFYRLTGDEMESEDLAQDVFLKLYRHLGRFRFEAEFKTYLYRINLNRARTYLRRNRWHLHLDQAPEQGDEDPEYERTWNRKALWNAVATLPKRQREVVVLRIAQGLPYRDIAALLGQNENAAKVNYHHAVENLKKRLI